MELKLIFFFSLFFNVLILKLNMLGNSLCTMPPSPKTKKEPPPNIEHVLLSFGRNTFRVGLGFWKLNKHKIKIKKGSTQPAAVKGAVKITPVQPPSPFVDCLCFQKESKGFEQEKFPLLQSPKTILVRTQRGNFMYFWSQLSHHWLCTSRPRQANWIALVFSPW